MCQFIKNVSKIGILFFLQSSSEFLCKGSQRYHTKYFSFDEFLLPRVTKNESKNLNISVGSISFDNMLRKAVDNFHISESVFRMHFYETNFHRLFSYFHPEYLLPKMSKDKTTSPQRISASVACYKES